MMGRVRDSKESGVVVRDTVRCWLGRVGCAKMRSGAVETGMVSWGQFRCGSGRKAGVAGTGEARRGMVRYGGV